MNEKVNRRNFITGGIRGVLLLGIGVMTGHFVLRNEETPEEQCDFHFACQNCNKLKHCGLPEAKKYKIGRINRSKP